MNINPLSPLASLSLLIAGSLSSCSTFRWWKALCMASASCASTRRASWLRQSRRATTGRFCSRFGGESRVGRRGMVGRERRGMREGGREGREALANGGGGARALSPFPAPRSPSHSTHTLSHTPPPFLLLFSEPTTSTSLIWWCTWIASTLRSAQVASCLPSR